MHTRTRIPPVIQHLPRPPVLGIPRKHFNLFIVVLDGIVAIVGSGGADKVDGVALKGEFDGSSLACQLGITYCMRRVRGSQ
jgi:hypothetical protein